MAWKIDCDYITAKDESGYAVGRGQGELEGETFTFRLLDDDNEVYYHGVADAAAAEDDDEDGGLYMAERWGAYWAGAIHLELHAADALKHGLTSRRYLESANLNDTTDWVRIYG